MITGAGLVTCLGLDVPSSWLAVRQGDCGIGPSNALQSTPRPDKGYGQAPPLPTDTLGHLPREARYLRTAIDEATRQAGLVDADGSWAVPPDRIGIVLGTTLHGMRAAGPYFRDNDNRALSTFLAASTLRLAAEDLPMTGQAITTCAACASGLMSIGLGMSLLQRGELDVVLAGGYDPVSEYAYGGFNSLRLVASSAQQPFSRRREGLKLAEGYGIVVLERDDDAASRDAQAIGSVLSCTASADAHHLSQPHPEGVGAARAIRLALDQAGLSPHQVALITAHATATPDNDRAEAMALSHVFGDGLGSVPVTAMKGALGHTLGAAGTVELILTLCALKEGSAPPVAGVGGDEVDFESLRVVTGQTEPITGRHALVTSLGFGGSNACAVVGVGDPKPLATAVHRVPPDDRSMQPVITGIGVVYPGAIGGGLQGAIRSGPGVELAVQDDALADLLKTRRVRRMSSFVKLALAATTLACRDAGIDDVAAYPGLPDRPPTPDRLAAVLGTAHGSAQFSEDYYRQLVDEGVDGVNPLLFAEGVPNAGTAHLSMMLGLTGPCQTLIGSRTSGLDAVRIAANRIANGTWDAAIVGGAEEHADLICRTYRHCGLHSAADPGEPFTDDAGFVCSAGAVVLVLESRQRAEERGVKHYASLTGWAQTAWPIDRLKPAIAQIAAMLEKLGLADQILSSANGTWIDRIEAMSIRLAGARLGTTPAVSAVAPRLHEAFSATPLLGLATTLLSRSVPGITGDGLTRMGGLRPAETGEPADELITLASDYNGASTAIRVGLPA